uniref:CUB domain-containing protein n=1 Tax=Macrostomum lignano TaxID=282301 RepID=A0A1I8GSU1_9PLAT
RRGPAHTQSLGAASSLNRSFQIPHADIRKSQRPHGTARRQHRPIVSPSLAPTPPAMDSSSESCRHRRLKANHSMRPWILLLQLLALLGHQTAVADALQKDCRCFRFTGAAVSEGSLGQFKSPMFPRAYPLSVSCLLYVFVAADNQIVRLKFERFELKPRIDGRCHDYVRLFLNSATAELSSEDRPSHELCGADLPQAEFYSSGRVLMLEFHSRLSPAYQTADSIKVFQGFKGSFSFEPA